MAEQEKRPPANVPFAAFESMVTIHERHVKRLLVALLITVLLLAASNGAWLYAWTRYDYASNGEETAIDVSQDGRGLNIYGDGNEVHNGTNDPYPKANLEPDTD